MRGSRMPCWAYAHCTRPEQSNPFSAVPPQRYGLPSASSAVVTMLAAFPVMVLGATRSKGGVDSLRPPPPPPPPRPRAATPPPPPPQKPRPAPTPHPRVANHPPKPRDPAPTRPHHR